MLSFGFAPILVRWAGDISPFLLAAFRTGFAVLILVPYGAYRGRLSGWTVDDAGQKDYSTFWYATFAGIALGIHFTFWIASLSYTSVASASVLVTIHPVMVILVERLLFKRVFSKTAWIGVISAFAGSVLLGVTDNQVASEFANPLLGNILAFTAAAVFVVYLLIGQRIRQQMGWYDYVFRVYFFAAVTCLLLNFIIGFDLAELSWVGVAAGIGLAVGPQIIGHGSMNYAVKYISPTLLSTLILAEPLIASVLAYFLFAEIPPLASIAAMVIILAGILLTWRRKSEKAGNSPK